MKKRSAVEKMMEESGIELEVIQDANVKHIDAETAYKAVGLRKSGIGFPYFNFHKTYVMSRLRKDEINEGEGRYHQKMGTKCLPYFLRSNLDAIMNSTIPLVIVEGEKKLLSAYSHLVHGMEQAFGLVSGSGCWGLLQKNEDGEHELSEEFKKIPLLGRVIYLIPDSDYFTNPDVKYAYDTLIELINEEGGGVGLIDIRGESEEKLGIDDFLVRYGLKALLTRMENPIALFGVLAPESQENDKSTDTEPLNLSDRLKTAEGEIIKFPEMTGFMKELYDWILATSPIKQPILSYGSVIAAIGTVLCHLYRINNSNPVFYQMFVARSGSGKDRPLKISKLIFGNEPLDGYIGLSGYRSDASIIDGLPKNRSRLDTLDEVDGVFKIAKGDSGYQSGIINILTELWSDTSNYFAGRRTREGQYGNCYNPCVNIISALAPTAFRENFNKSMMLTGFGGRFLYYIANENFEYSDNFVGIDMSTVPDAILEAFKHWHSLKRYDEEKKRFNITNLPISPDARELMDAIRKEYYLKAMKLDEDDSLSPIMQRFYENLERLLIVHACAQSPYTPSPIVQVSNVIWCRDFLEALHQNNKFFIRNNVAATPYEHLKSKLLTPIAKAGRNGVSHSKLLRDSHIPARQMADIIKTLVESEQITEIKMKKAKRYFYVDKKSPSQVRT